MQRTSLAKFGRYVGPLVAPVALCALVVLILREPLVWWLQGDEKFDQEAITEWIRESRPYNTLPELVREYLDQADQLRQLQEKTQHAEVPELVREARQQLDLKREAILEHLKALGNPPTKMYPQQLPLFPVIYRLTVQFGPDGPPIVWESELPRQQGQYRELTTKLLDGRDASVTVHYHLHAYTQRQARERQEVTRRLWLSGLGVFAAVAALSWIYIAQRRQRERQRQQTQAEYQIGEAERLRLQEELRRQEAERQKEEAERQALELKSQLFANIGIMAGSYAHNIKNLLVRPNDLLRRCLEDGTAPGDYQHMLHEVRQTLGTVTERLQQILKTVNRDPSQSERVRLDLNAMVQDIQRTWSDLARDKWKMALELDLEPRDAQGRPLPLWIEGDLSHLQQVLENLLTNARDATFEMRNYLRDQARRHPPFPPLAKGGEGEVADAPARKNAEPALARRAPELAQRVAGPADTERRQALIAAAAWKGAAVLRTRRQGDRVILEVQDNGLGMSEEVRRRCTETHFSTKRNNALFAGLSAGMGLGLSFVTVILGHHGAALEVVSELLQGATFRVSFPAAP